ncbi:hypothetical protein BGZ72_008282 [Mortierella alpina]|nr:hypothetical protein BGZ72_008282 [Mortierella alpina]
MPKFLKSGKVVVLLNGRYAGKKAVLIKNNNPTTFISAEYSSCLASDEGAAANLRTQTLGQKTMGLISGQEDQDMDHGGITAQGYSTGGTKERGYGHAIVAGIERYPLKITKNMGKKRVAKRSKVKPFIKVVNYNHIMPTRYGLELESLKSVVTLDSFKEPSQREESKKAVKKLFEERYNSGKNKWFFTKLRF